MNRYLENVVSNQDILRSVGVLQAAMGSKSDYLPTRVSYKLNLRGPSINVQTACSTSLVAIHQACRSLVDGECDMALAGGASISVPGRTGYLYVEDSILSPDGHCRAFDAKAQGTIMASGVGVVVLKRLDDAVADGDVIHAVIRGTAINNDGSSKVGYTAPSVNGQAAVIARAQAVAGVEPAAISYVEAHGTGTALGDPVEIAALAEAFGSGAAGTCAIGTLKSNLGHLDAAAGVAGVIKTALALEHRTLPPSLHYTTPNPKIDFGSTPFFVNTSRRDVGAGRWQPPRRRQLVRDWRDQRACGARRGAERRPVRTVPLITRAAGVGAQPRRARRVRVEPGELSRGEPRSQPRRRRLHAPDRPAGIRVSPWSLLRQCRRSGRGAARTRCSAHLERRGAAQRRVDRVHVPRTRRAGDRHGSKPVSGRAVVPADRRRLFRSAATASRLRFAQRPVPRGFRQDGRGRAPEADRLHAARAVRDRVHARQPVAVMGHRAAGR